MNRRPTAHLGWGTAGFFGVAIAIGGIVLLLAGSGAVGETAFAACAIAPEFVDDPLVAPQAADDRDCTAPRTPAGAWAVAGAVAITARSALR